MDPNIPTQPVPPEVPIIQPTETPKSSKSKFILIILAVVIVLIIIGTGGYYLGTRKVTKQEIVTKPTVIPTATPTTIPTSTATGSLTPTQTITSGPTPNPTANWKTYSSPTLGITFSYPKDYKTQEFTNRVGVIKGLEEFVFDVKKIITTDTINVWWQKGGHNDEGSYLKTSDYIKSTQALNSYDAYLFKLNSNNYQIPSDFYAIKKDNAIYIISFETDFPLLDQQSQAFNPDFDRNGKPIVQQILNSFKFTN